MPIIPLLIDHVWMPYLAVSHPAFAMAKDQLGLMAMTTRAKSWNPASPREPFSDHMDMPFIRLLTDSAQMPYLIVLSPAFTVAKKQLK